MTLTLGTKMTFWVAAYFGLFLTVTASALFHAYWNDTPRLAVFAFVLSEVTIGYLFLAFWYPALRLPLSVAAPAFVAALSWTMIDILEDIRTLPIPQNYSVIRLRLTYALALILMLLVNGPAFAIAGITAFKR